MSRENTFPPDTSELLEKFCEGELSPAEAEKLEHLVCTDPEVCRLYIRYVDLHVELFNRYKNDETGAFSVVGGAIGPIQTEVEISNGTFPVLSPPPSLSTTHYPLSTNFVGGLVFSYMVASVVLCMMLMGAWAYKITNVDPLRPSIAEQEDHQSPVFVGRIVGTKDCVWAKDSLGTMVGASVPFGREYVLSSGLLEIMYTSGARVILEGPCDYTVDSRDGGFLHVGKLVARVEKREERREERREKKVASAKPQAADPQPPAPSPQPLFSVRTPSAVVTDLGTEFGVEVNAEGDTISHVFRGSVRVQVIGGTGSASGTRGGTPEEGPRKELVLRADESARVEKIGRVRETHQGQPATEVVRFTHPTTPPTFTRRMRDPPKQLDLLDIVAGGDGTGNRRERGIDPATGKQDTWFIDNERQDDHGYHRVTWHKLIDGVFIPYLPTCLPPAPLDVQIDSTGSTFDRFLEGKVVEGKHHYASTIQGYTKGSIWSRAADAKSARAKNGDGWIYSLIDDTKHMPKGRGLLGLHANVGITFDLAAMRKMYDGIRPSRLRATISMGDGPRKYPDAFGVADLWIIVDGRLEWVRKNIRHKDGTIDVDLSLGARDRFLTIVSTNGSFGKAYDWIVLGDPVLEMKPTQSEEH